MKTKAPVVIDLAQLQARLHTKRADPVFHDDPRYAEFRERYGADLCAFAEEVFGVELDPETRKAYLNASKPGTRMVLSDVLDMREARFPPVALWAMLFHPCNEVVVIAPRNELHRCHWRAYMKVAKGAHGWLGKHLRITQSGIRTEAGYLGPRISFRTATNHSPENLAGMSGHQMLFLVEGAARIGDQCIQVLHASLREPMVSEVLALSCFTVVQTSPQVAH